MYRPYMEECTYCRRPILIEINFNPESGVDEKALHHIFVEHPTCSDCLVHTLENSKDWPEDHLGERWVGDVRDWIKRYLKGGTKSDVENRRAADYLAGARR